MKLGILVLASCFLAAAEIPWNFNALSKAPKTYPVATEELGVHAVFYDGVPWHGKPTRIFAYYGIPSDTRSNRYPAMVLIHGGGGTAFAEWVRLWNRRGYAAIAMDTVGTVPELAPKEKPYSPERERHDHGGPPGWGGFDQINEPVSDQWSYHAVAAVILGHSLLRSLPEVDPERIGVTGISWGGYLTNIVAGVDSRFRFAAPVYGCGFLGEDSAWLPNFEKMGPELRAKWLGLWDPSEYLSASRMPMLWVSGTNDFAYPLPSLQKSYRLPSGTRTLSIRVRMPHGHPQGAIPEEIRAFADAVLKKGAPLVKILETWVDGDEFSVRFRSPGPVVKAELNYTEDSGVWKDRKWLSIPAIVNGSKKRATGNVPAGAQAYFLNLFDAEGQVVSSEHVTKAVK